MAALSHDFGHLPFSHAAEKDLLPKGWTHERLSVEFIRSHLLQRYWGEVPPIESLHVAKLAVGQEHIGEDENGKSILLDDLEAILSEMITSDVFGADRIDYLLRDSLHSGVAYGRFDHARLIDTLRILPSPSEPSFLGGDEGSEEFESSQEPQLGVEQGGLQSAEGLALARYFMYGQVYFHPVRRIYDIHLKDFLQEWLPNGRFSVDLEQHLALTDAQITVALQNAARDPAAAGHDAALRIVKRRHFKVLWEWNNVDAAENASAGGAIFDAACDQFGPNAVRWDRYAPQSAKVDFPVQLRNEQIVWASSRSEVLKNLPATPVEYVFINPDLRDRAEQWLRDEKPRILQRKPRD